MNSTPEWLRPVLRTLSLAREGALVLVVGQQPAALVALARAVIRYEPAAEVIEEGIELHSLSDGAAVVALFDEADFRWLNLYRDIVHRRRLRVVFWVESALAASIPTLAPDCFSWVRLRVDAPLMPTPHGVAALKAGEGEVFVWRGDDFFRAFGVAYPQGHLRTIQEWPSEGEPLVAEPPGAWLIVDRPTGFVALADCLEVLQRGRWCAIVVVEPLQAVLGAVDVEAACMPLAAARALLAVGGGTSTVALALLVGLEEAAVDAAVKGMHRGLAETEVMQLAIAADDPGGALIDCDETFGGRLALGRARSAQLPLPLRPSSVRASAIRIQPAWASWLLIECPGNQDLFAEVHSVVTGRRPVDHLKAPPGVLVAVQAVLWLAQAESWSGANVISIDGLPATPASRLLGTQIIAAQLAARGSLSESRSLLEAALSAVPYGEASQLKPLFAALRGDVARLLLAERQPDAAWFTALGTIGEHGPLEWDFWHQFLRDCLAWGEREMARKVVDVASAAYMRARCEHEAWKPALSRELAGRIDAYDQMVSMMCPPYGLEESIEELVDSYGSIPGSQARREAQNLLHRCGFIPASTVLDWGVDYIDFCNMLLDWIEGLDESEFGL